MANGTMKWFDATKGYGFIETDKPGEKDVFLHVSQLERSGLSDTDIPEGTKVSFDLTPGRDGRDMACNVALRQSANA